MKFHHVALCLAALSLAACASKPPTGYVSMSYSSTPSGALVVRDGVTVGRTPMTLLVKAPLKVSETDGTVSSGCLIQDPVTFKWASGAKATVANPCQSSSMNSTRFEKVPGSKKQYNASISMSASRPVDAPGLTKDLKTATGLTMFASIPLPGPPTEADSQRRSGRNSDYGYPSFANGALYNRVPY